MKVQRLDLETAGKLFGITTNAMRARAKKSPEMYRLEADNSGKLWVWIDPELSPSKNTKLKLSKKKFEGLNTADLKASIEAVKETIGTAVETATLKERICNHEAQISNLQKTNDDLRTDRDRWHALAIRPWWKRLTG